MRMNEVCECTGFCSVYSEGVAPWSRSYGVVGLDLNLVVGPGFQSLYCSLSGPPCSLYILGPVLPLTICPPHTQPVSHRFWTAVVLWLWKWLEGGGRKQDQKDILCHLLLFDMVLKTNNPLVQLFKLARVYWSVWYRELKNKNLLRIRLKPTFVWLEDIFRIISEVYIYSIMFISFHNSSIN